MFNCFFIVLEHSFFLPLSLMISWKSSFISVSNDSFIIGVNFNILILMISQVFWWFWMLILEESYTKISFLTMLILLGLYTKVCTLIWLIFLLFLTTMQSWEVSYTSVFWCLPDEFGKVVVDVNYLNVGDSVPNFQIFIC